MTTFPPERHQEQMNDGTFPIQSSEDLVNRNDEQLIARLKYVFLAGVDTREAIYGELQRRWMARLRDSAASLAESSRRLEWLTWALIALTAILAIETVARWLHN